VTATNNSISYRFLSKFYDLFDLIFLLGGKGNPRAGLLKVVSPSCQTILDICVGTASSAILLAAHHRQSHVQGIDISSEMLSAAQAKIAREKLNNLELKQMSADCLQFSNNIFDCVMISFALHEFDADLRERVIREAVRVLKPGGQFCVIDFARQTNSANRIFMKFWMLIEPKCFRDFLNMDWHEKLKPYGLLLESEHEYSFSKLYVLCKSETSHTITDIHQ